MDDVRVTSIELFFDLVFVFTITQLTSLLVSQPDGAGLAKVILIFGNIWWMYGGYAWLTNAVPPKAIVARLLLLVGMAGYLIVALAVPRAFGSSGVPLGVGYLVVVAVHTGLFLQATEESAVRAMTRLGPYNTVTAALLLVAGFTHGNVRWGLWVAAFVLHWTTPAITAVGGFRIRAGHFVERHGQIVLIALGESVVAVGIGLQGRSLTSGLVVTSLLGLLVAAGLWWLYFDGEDERAERSLHDAPLSRNPWLALFAFGYAFLPLLTGVVVFAAGVKGAVVSFDSPAPWTTAWFLAGGVAGYVAALALLRYILQTGQLQWRLAIAAAALATVLVGREVSPEWQLGVLALVLVVGILVEAVSTAGGFSSRSSASE